MSGASKLAALTSTYPYQVIRSRIQVSVKYVLLVCLLMQECVLCVLHPQNNTTRHLYPDIPTCIRRTFQNEGLRGFYRGLGTNVVRVLPGTCVTFVVYENIAWLLRMMALRREQKQ